MKRRTNRVLSTAVALIALLLPGVPASAAAATDTEPPTLTFPSPKFLVGSQVIVLADEDGAYYTKSDVLAKVEATDDVGICRYEWGGLEASGAGPNPWGYRYTNVTVFQAIGYLESFQGSSSNYQMYMKVSDCAGNSTTIPRGRHAAADDIGARTPRHGWRPAYFRQFAGGSTLQTSQRDASYDLTVAGTAIGLVMAMGPTRGSADVYLDGRKVRTVNTFAPSNANAIIQWSTRLPPGEHALRIVNRATPGHPRIDLDAVVRY